MEIILLFTLAFTFSLFGFGLNNDKSGGEDDPDDKTGSSGGGKSGDGSGGEGAGGAADPMSRRQFLDELAGAQIAEQTPEGGELTPEQTRDIREATREFIRDAQEDFEDMLPDATRSQQQAFAKALLESDAAEIIKVVQDAVRVTQEKEDQDRRDNADDLHVQRGGGGKAGDNNAPTSMRGAMAQAAQNLRGRV